MIDEFRIGVVTSTHGLKGELKVFPTTDDINRFKTLKKIRLKNGSLNLEVEAQSARFFKGIVILKLKGYDHINQVEGFKKAELFVDREAAIDLAENEFYVGDIIGARAMLTDGSSLGEITDVISTGANDVFAVESPQYGQILIPSIRQCVKELDAGRGIVIFELMDGMLPDKAVDK